MSAGPAHSRRALLLRNPVSRRAPALATIEAGVARLRRAGWEIEVRSTTVRGEAVALARTAAAEGFGTVIACGGDGTVREAVEGLAGSEVALAVLPAGTANVWAHEARIPLDLAGALALVARGRRVRIDTGLANGHRFLLMCSAGLDATTVHAMEGSPAKRTFGALAYAAAGVRNAALTPAVRAAIEVGTGTVHPDHDDHLERLERDVLMAVVGNSRLFGLVARVTADARVDDGLLDVCVLSESSAVGRVRGMTHRLALAWAAGRGALPEAATRGRPGVDYHRATRVRIESRTPLDVQADGDWIGTTPVDVVIDPGSLTVVVPWGPNPLWE